MTAGWGLLIRLCLVNAAIVWLAALPVGAVTGFIGCRRQRAGLYKTLGAGHFYDIAFMPGLDVFSPASDTLRTAMKTRVQEIGANAV